jgi:hypothetical protein
MPKRRYEQREPTHDWQQIRPFLKDSAQITYEVIRPCILGWETPKERAAETGMPMSSIYYKANLFDQAGMASLLPPAPPPEIPEQDKRSLPPPEEAVVHEAFSAICETRRLDKAGYAKFRNWSHDARTRPGRGDHAGQYLPGFPHPGV